LKLRVIKKIKLNKLFKMLLQIMWLIVMGPAKVMLTLLFLEEIIVQDAALIMVKRLLLLKMTVRMKMTPKLLQVKLRSLKNNYPLMMLQRTIHKIRMIQ